MRGSQPSVERRLTKVGRWTYASYASPSNDDLGLVSTHLLALDKNGDVTVLSPLHPTFI